MEKTQRRRVLEHSRQLDADRPPRNREQDRTRSCFQLTFACPTPAYQTPPERAHKNKNYKELRYPWTHPVEHILIGNRPFRSSQSDCEIIGQKKGSSTRFFSSKFAKLNWENGGIYRVVVWAGLARTCYVYEEPDFSKKLLLWAFFFVQDCRRASIYTEQCSSTASKAQDSAIGPHKAAKQVRTDQSATT